MKVYVVRYPNRPGSDASQPQWMGMAEDESRAAVFATIHGGPFPIDAGDLVVYDHDGNPGMLVTMSQRLASLRT